MKLWWGAVSWRFLKIGRSIAERMSRCGVAASPVQKLRSWRELGTIDQKIADLGLPSDQIALCDDVPLFGFVADTATA
jgi:hypothetical protein